MTLVPLLLAGTGLAAGPLHPARDGRPEIRPPRVDTTITVDGRLDEPVWARAALLTGFSQYSPSDGVPASDSTEVLVWYSSTAMYFGIRAFERHGAPTATLADRDRIFNDDNVQLLLGTFDDGHQALMFAVNPLGVQGDGSIVEGRNTSAGGFIGGAVVGREQPDLSPDYVYQSRGRITEWGYEVEVRIPFRSLRYQRSKVQTWSLNIVRQVKHSGFEDSWAPARRASPSFVGQSGALVGLTGLHRGLVMDLNPEATGKAVGAPGPAGYAYDVGEPQVGGNLRWGVSDNLTLNGTVRPDFSQVESDAGQLAFDPRQALFFPEKRPFFQEGSELFQVPNNLIYTRRIVQPIAAVKLTGNAFGADLGLLSAVDRKLASASGEDHPVLNLLRAQRNLGGRSRIGLAWTDRADGHDYNRVADLDGRLVFGGISSVDFQLAASRTRAGGLTTTAPLWRGQLSVRGRVLGLSALFSGIADDFRAGSGFIGRPGIVHASLDPSFTTYGRRGGLLERFTGDIVVDGTWQYQSFIHGRGVQDRKLHFNGNAALRGGWNVGAGLFFESFGYDSALYAGYRLEIPRPAGGLDTIPFVGQPTIPNVDYIFQVSTPQWRHFSGSWFVALGRGDENFFEWASANLVLMNLGLVYRPTDRLRAEFTYAWQQVNRRTDGSLVNVGRIPRLKLEYQITRPLFVRLVGQYFQEKTDSLRDDSRTNAPILIPGPDGLQRAAATESNLLHADLLLGFQPVPGTVIFAGYGGDLTDASAFSFRDLHRTRDSFFVKLSYLFRL
ncbi:MAG TPA: DUF5916 domain-containing protein [Gemmatimonadales bacterium]|jgi:hypothetical protein|nr:DUF5916 domain-containing protein [Gemmatimonadales bacterium]